MVSLELLAQQFVNGLFFGGQLALIAIGLTLIWGVARVLNFSHGAMFMVGGFVGYYTLGATGSVLLASVLAVVVVFALGYVIEHSLLEPMRDREEFDIASMVVTLGLAIFLENAILVGVGSQRKSFPLLTDVVWNVAGLTISAQRLVIFVISLVALGLLFLVITGTKLGLAIRAVSQDSDTALLMGVRPKRVYSITFGASAALAGLAGVLLAPMFSVYPSVGWYPFLLAFIVVMVGGLGSVRGTLVAALGLAVVRSISMIWIASETAMMVLFAIMVGVLVVNPDGIGGWLDG
ncbi:branched-chain amino acid ABC transporter permease [Halorarum salinum]|uniref:Branched-chain amino acid ABC transporter permease n=1 Tax=Halorarum salinum TaxID=2743089 RepID=A0A7D5QCK4_9EURY|nr:branched-chain amino acid ABC transporter permease [Halobaculum salinum]QLG63418.1 branched-chain amino acid ABC transporter permease [Halobaculum salinum]